MCLLGLAVAEGQLQERRERERAGNVPKEMRMEKTGCSESGRNEKMVMETEKDV